MKKIVSVLTLVSLILFFFNLPQSTKAETKENEKGKGCLCEKGNITVEDTLKTLEKQGTDVIQEVPKKSQKKAELIVKKDSTIKRISIISDYHKQGYKKINDAQTFVEFKNLEDQGIIYDDIMNYTIHYYNEEQDRIIRENFWIDMKEEKILASNIILLDLKNNDGYILDTFNVGKIDGTQSSNLVQVQGKSFQFNGVSFACSVAGIIACASACGGLHFIPGIGPAVGGACDLACALAFAAGCSVS